MKVTTATIFVLFCSLISLAFSQSTYKYTFLNNGTCQTVQAGDCIPCIYYEGYPTRYFQIQPSNYGGFEALEYEDSACTEQWSWTEYYQENCNTENYWFGNCVFFTQLTSVEVISLTLSSTAPISVTIIGDSYPVGVYSEISANKIIAQGEELTGVQIHSAGKTFFVEKQVSPTQYSTSLGVYTIGETYTHSPFTFSVTSSVINIPPPNVPSDSTTVSFSSFFTAQVTNDNTFPAYTKYSGELNIFVDQSTYSLDGLILSNPFYSIVNMTLFPPFNNNNYGELVFQLEKSNTPYLTVECYYESTGFYSFGVTADNFDCSMGSFSGIFSGSFLSFSLDEFGEPKRMKPDEMSFSLF